MNKKIFLSICTVCLGGLFGCTTSRPDAYVCNGPDCQPNTVQICETPDNPALCSQDPFVNYTRTAANFRAYGERTPRDRLISQAAAGNNLVATIPPSIEDEVVSYEEQLEKQQPEKVEDSVQPEAVEKVETKVEAEEAKPVEETQETQEAENTEENNDVEIADNDLLEVEVTEEISEETDDEEEDPVQDWLAEEGQNLKALLSQWSAQSGWRLIWNTNRNYVLNAGAMFRGRFADVSSALIRAFARARPAPIATFYKGNRVLVVETMEDENAYE